MAEEVFTSVRVKKSTSDKLNRLRESMHLDTVESVILWLLGDLDLPGTAPIEIRIKKK